MMHVAESGAEDAPHTVDMSHFFTPSLCAGCLGKVWRLAIPFHPPETSINFGCVKHHCCHVSCSEDTPMEYPLESSLRGIKKTCQVWHEVNSYHQIIGNHHISKCLMLDIISCHIMSYHVICNWFKWARCPGRTSKNFSCAAVELLVSGGWVSTCAGCWLRLVGNPKQWKFRLGTEMFGR